MIYTVASGGSIGGKVKLSECGLKIFESECFIANPCAQKLIRGEALEVFDAVQVAPYSAHVSLRFEEGKYSFSAGYFVPA